MNKALISKILLTFVVALAASWTYDRIKQATQKVS
jgi:hypothetical protein